MSSPFAIDSNPFQTKLLTEDSGNVSETESVSSVSSNGSTGSSSGKKKLRIKTKKRSDSSDTSVTETGSVSDSSTTKKSRKPRTTKPNELEKYGFNSELTWNFPKMKKYMDDTGRTCINITEITKSTKDNSHYEPCDDEKIGIHVTFRKGVKEESILFITKFEPGWLSDVSFSNYLNSFAGKSSKSSRLVIIHSSAKAWGAKKVNEAMGKIKELEVASQLANQPTNTHVINFSGPTTTSSTTTVVEEIVSEPVQPITMKAKMASTPIDFNTEFARLTAEFQKQMELASRNYQAELAKLTMAIAQATT